MGINLINASKASVNTPGNLRKDSKNSAESKFNETFENSIQAKETKNAMKNEKSTYEKATGVHKKSGLKEKEDTDSKDNSDEDSNVSKTEKYKTDTQNILNMLLGLNTVNENVADTFEGINNINAADKLKLLELLQSSNQDSKLEKLIADMMEADSGDSLDDTILNKLKALLSEENNNGYNEIILQQENPDQKDNSKGDSYGSTGERSMNSSKEEKVLNSILGEKDDNSSKAAAMSAHLNRFRQDINTNSEPVNVPVVNRNTFNGDIIKAVKYMEVNSLRELTVNINPRELGAITIRITMEAGIMKANISAANKETLELLNSNLIELRNSLNNPDIKVQDVSINIYNEDTTFFSGNFGDNKEGFNGNGQGRSQGRILDAGESEDTKKEKDFAAIDNNLSILA